MLNKLTTPDRGPISWMVNNRVTPNLLMGFGIAGQDQVLTVTE